MILFDVNVLIYATSRREEDYGRYQAWLEGELSGSSAFGVSELVLSSYLRIVTNRRIFETASSPEAALEVTGNILSRPNCVVIRPGARHWEIFAGLVRQAKARGNLVADAYLAALAIESGSEWITTDRDFARFPGLRWRHPLE
ncbi:MAG: type II toxin-antitoxin system VapC family toxin [Pirellulales bacterium]